MTGSMVSYDLPIKISQTRGGFSIAVALNDQVVVSRQISRADLVQLQVVLAEILNDRQGARGAGGDRAPAPQGRPADQNDDFLFDIDT
ncbi:hypothetical protein ACFOGJ_27990 [Marinibaculum pumilum]|uniref:Uncharacterized protein n=1 Tax=Marinibaculum pumilum TaxID=1766165 RepID=A0ABV7L8W5_9PROT